MRDVFRLGAADVFEFLRGPVGFSLLRQYTRHRLAQFDQQFHVQGGVVEPLGGQRAPRPVGRPVPLGQSEAQQPLDHGRQVHPVEPGQAPGELGVVELRRPHADLGQARQVLIGGVQDPFVVAQHGGDRPQRGERVGAVADRVDEHRARAGPPDLDQIRAVGVAEPRRALGVHRERPVPAAQELRGCLDVANGHRQARNPVRGAQQRSGRGFGAVGFGAVGFGAGGLGAGGFIRGRCGHVRRVTAS